MKIIVTGGRDYSNPDHIFEVLDDLAPDTVVFGDCRTGADSMALEWCRANGAIFIGYPANWTRFDRAAGPIRNGLMVRDNQDATYLVAFKGGKGTNDCLEKAKRVGIEIMDLREEE